MKPVIGKLCTINKIERNASKKVFEPAMALWKPESFGGEPFWIDNALCEKAFLIVNIEKHRDYKTKEILLELLFGKTIYWTDWFEEKDFGYFFSYEKQSKLVYHHF